MSLTLREIAVKLMKGELPALSDGELAGERMKVCLECPQFQRLSRQCAACGCFLDLKTKLLEASCPLHKW
jgi:uncharacterized iron-regulated protein